MADHQAGVGELHPGPFAVGPPSPAGVDQPHLRLMLAQLLSQHLRVDRRMAGEERRTEARAEGGLRLRYAPLGARQLRGVPRQEMVHRLLGRQPRDRGQHAEGIGGQEHYLPRVAADPRQHRVRNEMDRVAGPRVLRDRIVDEIGVPGILTQHHVFQNCSEALGGGEDFRLPFRREVDRLRVTATLEVEDPVVAPAVFVVADQARSFSAESVVLPVPERPKKRATSPSRPTLAEQCIGKTPRPGRM